MSTTTAPAASTRNRVVAGIAVAALALGAAAAGVAYTVRQDEAQAASSSSASGGNHDVRPSNAIKALQQELAELNFYQGPINGYDTPATVAAVQNLQAQAGLPQTGQMNAQTRTALMNYLAQGSNTMNS
jgi:peptidoglycan hydrolase-like protein with peptidoglycan-binding domain